MRLLSIRFQNLNSLRGAHEVDLEHGALADAGLFAITGPTGAGKSTILDAVTLALYGRAARYGTSKAEDMLSRGAPECMAAVEFECDSGRYVGAWSMKRSRGKSDGKIQPPKHELSQNGAIIEEKTTGVTARIESLTGLDYERFLRSVLLAQGQFAAFLKADTRERADLLQRITGSQIYSELGKLAHEIAQGHAREVGMETARLSGITFLSAEERDSMTVRAEALSAELRERSAQESVLQNQVTAAKRTLVLHDQESALAAECALHREASAAFAESAERLRLHVAAAPFAGLLCADTQSERTLLEASHGLSSAVSERELAQSVAEEAAGATVAALDASEAVAQAKLSLLKKDRAELALAISSAEEWLTQHRADAGLTDALPLLAELKTGAGAALERKQEAEKLLAVAIARRDAETKTATEREAASEAAARLVSTAAADLEKADVALSSLLSAPIDSVEAVEAESARLLKLSDVLARLRSSLTATSQQKEALQKQEQELAAAEPRRKEAEAVAASSAEKLASARREESLLQELVRQEGVIRSLKEHRSHLQSGKPCPLCGAVEHPWAAGHESPREPAAERLKAQQEEVERASAAVQSAAAGLAALEKTLAAAAAGLNAQRASMERETARLQAEWSEYFPDDGFSDAALSASTAVISEKSADVRALQERVRAAVQSQREARETAKQRAEEARSATALASAALGASRQAVAAMEQGAVRVSDAVLMAEGAVNLLNAEIASHGGDCVEASGAVEQLRERARMWQERQAYREGLDKKAALLKHEEEALALDISGRAERRRQELEAIGAAGVKATPAHHERKPTQAELRPTLTALHTARSREDAARRLQLEAVDKSVAAQRAFASALERSTFSTREILQLALLDEDTLTALNGSQQILRETSIRLEERRVQLLRERSDLATSGPVPDHTALPVLVESLQLFSSNSLELRDQRSAFFQQLKSDDETRARHAAAAQALEERKAAAGPWERLAEIIGNADGSKFSRFAQSLTLDVLLSIANAKMQNLCDRYRLIREGTQSELGLQISDSWQGEVVRPMESLSGGETFLVSLALALALSELAGRRTRIATLFIDEGFGTLDATSLDTALSALESMRTAHTTIGVISHVESLKARLTTQVEVSRGPGGWSNLSVKY